MQEGGGFLRPNGDITGKTYRPVGGLTEYAETNDTYGTQPISYILNTENVILNLISYSSLNGFIFEIILPEDAESPYLGHLAGVVGVYQIRRFIIKLVVTTTNSDDHISPYGPAKKKPAVINNFILESNIQDNVWLGSVSENIEAISPPVLYAKTFNSGNSNRHNIEWLLNLFTNKRTTTVGANSTHTLIHYLKKTIINTIGFVGNRGLGIILMPAAPNAVIFYDFIDSIQNRITNREIERNAAQNILNDLFASVIAQIVRMYIYLKVIHLDLHGGNILIYEHKGSGDTIMYKSSIIDFGIASKLDTMKSDAYFSRGEKSEMDAEITELAVEFEDLISKSAIELGNKGALFIKKVIEYIRYYDAMVHYSKYKFINDAFVGYTNDGTKRTVVDRNGIKYEIFINANNPNPTMYYNNDKYVLNADNTITVFDAKHEGGIKIAVNDGDNTTKTRPTVTEYMGNDSVAFGFDKLFWMKEYINNEVVMKNAFDKLKEMMKAKLEPDNAVSLAEIRQSRSRSRSPDATEGGPKSVAIDPLASEPKSRRDDRLERGRGERGRRERGGKSKKSKPTKKSKTTKKSKKSKKSKTL